MRLFIARPLPDAVLDAARAAFDVTVRPSNAPMSDAEMIAALTGYDVVLPTLGDRFQAHVLQRGGRQGRPPAGLAVEDETLATGENRLVVGAVRIDLELEHAPRGMESARDHALAFEFAERDLGLIGGADATLQGVEACGD